jgi:putative membrane protein
LTWLLETAPVMIAIVVLTATYRRFPFTNLVYALILIHCVILMVGGHYTYAKVPFGFWIRDTLHLNRNPYDRIGHFAQGFVCLAISALYELVEWRTSVMSGEAADAFLGSQGDVWDTQWDMSCALIGACTALALLSRAHDRQLDQVAPDSLSAQQSVAVLPNGP